VVLKDFLLSEAHNANTPFLCEFLHDVEHQYRIIKTPNTNYDTNLKKFIIIFQFFFPLLSCKSFKRSHNPQVEATQTREMIRIVFKKKEKEKNPIIPKDSHLQ
jgi:hypothetical protein